MTHEKGFEMTQQPTTDYFAGELLTKLDTADPAFAAFEAQDVSRDVGFDFADFNDVVPRALDEVRETEEAYHEMLEGGAVEREHFGDEIADIMFSHVNLARHAGLGAENFSLPRLAEGVEADDEPVETTTQRIRERITTVAEEAEETGTPSIEKVFDMYAAGMRDAIKLALSQGFDPDVLLRENVRKYLQRCKGIEDYAQADGKSWANLAAAGEIIAYWKRVKQAERGEAA